VRVRFAPSPTGSLHIGSARTALYNFLFARHHGGIFVVRIEDTDVARSEARFETAILEDLAWLGLQWDEGPGRGGPVEPYRQSERQGLYRAAARDLLERGLAYRCFCSQERLDALREERLAAGLMPKYDRHCHGLPGEEVERRLASGEPAALRFAVPGGEIVVDDLIRGRVGFASDVIGDFIILRSDGRAGYNFAAAVDDAGMRISHVIRGEDHLTNTARQVLLLRALGAAQPCYAHHSLILGPDGAKLSKRHGATAVGEFRDLGYLPSAVTNYLALLSWSHGEREVLTMHDLIAEFDLAALSGSPAIFDVGKLDWLDHEYVLALDAAEHERLFAAQLPAGVAEPAAHALAEAFKPSLVRYGDAAHLAAEVLEAPPPPPELAGEVAAAATALCRFAGLRAAAGDWVSTAVARSILTDYRALGPDLGLNARGLLRPLRIALTGREHGPELHFVIAALDREEALHRLDRALVAGGAEGLSLGPIGPVATDDHATGSPSSRMPGGSEGGET
jgi:nondiscriminating glutamyl-tRNA synthetase